MITVEQVFFAPVLFLRFCAKTSFLEKRGEKTGAKNTPSTIYSNPV